MEIAQIQRRVHENAIDKGWWGRDRSFGDLIALCHSELSEALEEYRSHREPHEIYWISTEPDPSLPTPHRGKPEGIPIELADVVIRVLDMAEWYGIDMEFAISLKHAYNLIRPERHGDRAI